MKRAHEVKDFKTKQEGTTNTNNSFHSFIHASNAFHSGDLSAFGRGHSLETMEAIRAKQERLARLHFDIGSSKGQGDNSHSSNWMSESDQNKLVAGLRELSLEIEKLHDPDTS